MPRIPTSVGPPDPSRLELLCFLWKGGIWGVLGGPVNFIDPEGLFFKDPNSAQANYYRRLNTPSNFDHRNRNLHNRVPSRPPSTTGFSGGFFGRDQDGRWWFNVDGKYRFFDGSEAGYRKDGSFSHGTYNYFNNLLGHIL